MLLKIPPFTAFAFHQQIIIIVRDHENWKEVINGNLEGLSVFNHVLS